MVTLKIKYDDVLAKISDEISRVADKAYDDEGNSLYDGIVVTSSDKETLTAMISDSINSFVRRVSDIVSGMENSAAEIGISLDVPDFDTSNFGGAVSDEFERHIVLNVCAAWLQERYSERSEEYVARGQVAADKTVALLKTRKKPGITRQ